MQPPLGPGSQPGAVASGGARSGRTSAPAAASSYDCPSGYFCGWSGESTRGSMWKTNKDVAGLGSWDDKIRSYVNRTSLIACLYDDLNYDSWGGYFPQNPNTPGEYSSSPTATISSIRFVRTERECDRPAYPGWYSEPSPTAAGFGDMNGDRRADVITRDMVGRLWFTPGDDTGRLIGAGGWNAMDTLTRHGDFSGDGREDVVAREKATGKLWLYPGTSTARLGARRLVGSGGWKTMEHLIPVGDFSGDGRPDLATVTNEKYRIYGVEGHPGQLITYRGRAGGTLYGPQRTHSEWWGLSDFC
ncbi:peptidase inhibitor family I36 protein [Streptomyces sp. NPDC085937]|uniref:peptidase inhibitor family I36 protein n=1 Tax=Streptomyces sp. NPDC085937 TaxID=3365742 RepID=UPI0037D356BD